jgi:2-polyprenyl-3-methyl-5-hydroxy-6-metoxy-1,4-benzoquinol methylase
MQQFADKYAKFQTSKNNGFFGALVEHLYPAADNPFIDVYFEFAITANDRGREVARILGRRMNIAGRDFIDVGCAYAGFLVAFSECGARVSGIELDPQLIRLAGANLSDTGLTAAVSCKDATKFSELAEYCNRVDIITCNDVIEHVSDPYSLLKNISLMLRENGAAYFEIPNRYNPSYVRADGHFGIFGITLLNFDDAKKYYELIRPGSSYGMGYYMEFDQYEFMFDNLGFKIELLEESFNHISFQSVLDDVDKIREECESKLATVPPELKELVDARIRDYLNAVEFISQRDKQQFMLNFGPGFWRILAKKKKA